ncbi:hypothetical protein FQN49_001372 [Arthroderma sp. PD_2]|nr:hypothetical protein FQN49_001372 [Arthroderma sp. PD_2]
MPKRVMRRGYLGTFVDCLGCPEVAAIIEIQTPHNQEIIKAQAGNELTIVETQVGLGHGGADIARATLATQFLFRWQFPWMSCSDDDTVESYRRSLAFQQCGQYSDSVSLPGMDMCPTFLRFGSVGPHQD